MILSIVMLVCLPGIYDGRKKNGTYVFFFPSQNHRISPEIFHVVIIIVVIIPIIIVVIWWLYDGIITYYIYIYLVAGAISPS